MTRLFASMLLVALPVVSDGCQCSDCGGFPPSYITFLRVTVQDSSAQGVGGAKIVLMPTLREQLDSSVTDSTGIAVLNHIMFENPETVTVAVHPAGGSLPHTTVRAVLKSQDTTHVAVTY